MLISSMTARGFTLTASCMNVPLSSENGPNDIACAQPSTSVKKAVAAFTSGTVMPVWSWPRMPGMESAKADDAAAESVSAAKASSALDLVMIASYGRQSVETLVRERGQLVLDTSRIMRLILAAGR